jgi:hypothetical protein
VAQIAPVKSRMAETSGHQASKDYFVFPPLFLFNALAPLPTILWAVAPLDSLESCMVVIHDLKTKGLALRWLESMSPRGVTDQGGLWTSQQHIASFPRTHSPPCLAARGVRHRAASLEVPREELIVDRRKMLQPPFTWPGILPLNSNSISAVNVVLLNGSAGIK